MIVATFGLAGYLEVLLKHSLLNDALVSNLVEDIVLHFLEGKIFTLLSDNSLITADDKGILRFTHVKWASILGDVDFVRLGHKGNSHTPSSAQLGLNECLNGYLQVHSLVEVSSKHECDKLRVTHSTLGGVFMREELLGNLLIVRDETIMENCDSFLLIKHRMCLFVAHGILTRGVAGVKDCNSALMHGVLRRLTLFLVFLNFDFINELIHFIEAVILLIDNHVILQHVLIICYSYHGHSKLLTG